MNEERSRPVQPLQHPLHLVPRVFALGTLVLAAAGLLRAPSSVHTAGETPDAEKNAKPLQRLHTLGGELRFEENAGQTDPRVRFLARGPGYTLFLTADEAVLRVPGAPSKTKASFPRFLEQPHVSAGPPEIWRQRLVGGNPNPHVEGAAPLPGKSNYFIGNDPSRWRTNVTQYARVRYRDVYPGIDLVYYGRAGQLEYDFVVSPGADPKQIRLAVTWGSSKANGPIARVDASGDLLLVSMGGELRLRRPEVYQEIDGRREPIEARYVLRSFGSAGANEENEVTATGTAATFAVAAYDPRRPLVIDPVLLYSTYLGGSGEAFGTAIAVDPQGHAYVTGSTSSADFPTENPIQPELGDRGPSAPGDVFVAKLSVEGDTLLYSTYLGGTLWDSGEGIAVDAAGHAYVTGRASSMDFPTTSGAFQSAPPGGVNAFVARLDPSGSSLVYSTFLGGSGSDYGDGIAVDADGNAYVTGGTGSADFPTENAFQAAFSGGGGHPYLASDAFVSKLDPTGSELIYSTYLGGPAEASLGVAVALDSEGNAYVTGATAAFDFPVTAEALQPELGGASDAFVTKLSPAGNEVVYSTFLGGSGDDAATAIAVDALGQAHVAGTSRSLDFPIANAFQDYNAGARDAFVAKLDATASALIYSTYLGGSKTIEARVRGLDTGEGASGIALDGDGNAYVSGTTNSTDFPIRDPFDSSNDGIFDGFVAQLDPTGSLVFSTFLGSGASDGANGIAVDGEANVYVTGITTVGARLLGFVPPAFPPKEFPTVNPFQPLPGGIDAFITKLTLHSRARLCAYALIFPFPHGVAPNTGTVAVIEAARKELMGEFRLGTLGDGLSDVAVSPEGGTAYVANSGTIFFPLAAAMRGPESFLAVVDTRLHAPATALAFEDADGGVGVYQVVLTPDGHTAYVGSNAGLLVIDTATNMEVARVPEVRGGVSLVMAPDGRRLYVSGVVPGVQVVDLAANAVVASIDFPHASFPTGAAITPDGAFLYVAANGFQALGVVDTITNSVVNFIPVPAYPNRIAISPDGRTAYVAHDRPRQFGTLSIIDTETESVIATAALDLPSNELAVTPDGKFIYLTNGPAGTVTVLETKTYQIVTIIPVGGNTGKIALATMPNGCMPVRACAGDCNFDRAVTINEVLLGVNIALGKAFATACRAADADGDTEVSINELVSAVRFATEGCAGGRRSPRDGGMR